MGLGLVLAYNVAGVHPDVAKFDKNMPVSDTLANLPTEWQVGIIVVVVCVLLDPLGGLAEQARDGRNAGDRRQPG